SIVRTIGVGASAGDIFIAGTGPATAGNNYGGVMLGYSAASPNTAITTVDGDISITGLAQAAGTNNHGIWLHDNIGRVYSSGAGAITLEGTATGLGNYGTMAALTSGGIGMASATDAISFIANSVNLLSSIT